MTLDALIMLCGAFVAVLPFLGFPQVWDNTLFFAVGIIIVLLGIATRRRAGKSQKAQRVSSYAESAPHSEGHDMA